MAKLIIPFNDKAYSVDELSLYDSIADLNNHISTTMNGSGSTINFNGNSFNVDSEKLLSATNNFASYLNTIAGNGCKIIVNGIEYNVDSTRLENAMTDITTVLNNLQNIQNNDIKNTWEVKNWSGYTSFLPSDLLFYENNIYLCGKSRNDYILNRETSTWEVLNWNWCEEMHTRKLFGKVWHFKNNLYRLATNKDNVQNTYVLNKETNTWEIETVITEADIINIPRVLTFINGEKIYGVQDKKLYMLNQKTYEWEFWKEIIWDKNDSYNQYAIWIYEGNVYYSLGNDKQYILNQKTNMWEDIKWNGYSDLYGSSFWTDGKNMYYSETYADEEIHLVLNTETNTWEDMEWNNFPYHDTSSSNGSYVWIDGDNVYYSYNKYHYVLV